MESILRKCLNQREKRFEINSCPRWLSTVLPNRIQSLTIDKDDHDQHQQQQHKEDLQRDQWDLSDYQLIDRIVLLNENFIEHRSEGEEEFSSNDGNEYPNSKSFLFEEYQNQFEHRLYFTKEDFAFLFQQLKKRQRNSFNDENNNNNNKSSSQHQCEEKNCFNRSIPLTRFCPKHLQENDSRQILFEKCSSCPQTILRHDKNNLFHFQCSNSIFDK